MNLSPNRGRGEGRVPAAPAASCAECRWHTSVVTTGPPEHPAFPHAMVLRPISCSCVCKIWQNVRTGGSDRPPVAGSEPVVLKGRKSLTGSEGQIRCLPQPEQLHGLRARTEQGRELDDGTKRFGCRRY